MTSLLRIATRRSPLALRQTELVRDALLAARRDLRVELLPMSTRGDEVLDRSLAEIGGKGLFIKELETALLEGRADIAVHSMKDMPARLPAGLAIAALLESADPRDALLGKDAIGLDDLRAGCRVGTSSPRRQAQLLAICPGVEVVPLRGSLGSRLAKLDSGQCDAIVLACAGFDRLGLADRIGQRLPPELFLPAQAQGVIGIESRDGDRRVLDLVAPLHHQLTATRVAAERALAARLEGSCQVPLAVYAVQDRGELWLRALLALPDGSRILRVESRGDGQDAAGLGERLADELLAGGGADILAALTR